MARLASSGFPSNLSNTSAKSACSTHTYTLPCYPWIYGTFIREYSFAECDSPWTPLLTAAVDVRFPNGLTSDDSDAMYVLYSSIFVGFAVGD